MTGGRYHGPGAERLASLSPKESAREVCQNVVRLKAEIAAFCRQRPLLIKVIVIALNLPDTHPSPEKESCQLEEVWRRALVSCVTSQMCCKAWQARLAISRLRSISTTWGKVLHTLQRLVLNLQWWVAATWFVKISSLLNWALSRILAVVASRSWDSLLILHDRP